MIDEPRSFVTLANTMNQTSSMQGSSSASQFRPGPPRPYSTLLVKGVDGYSADGVTKTAGKELMLFVTGYDPTTNNPVVRAVNGPKSSAADEFCTIPEIPSGTECVILANSLYETQKEVDPDLIVPRPRRSTSRREA